MQQTLKKRLFIGLICATCVLVCLLLCILFAIPYVGLSNIHPAATWLWGGLLLTLCLVLFWATLGVVLNVWFARPILFSGRLRGVIIKLFLPLMVLLGRLVGVSKTKIRSSFINVNNEMVLAERGTYKPGEILLLMPHCLQRSTCDRRLTYDINNCKRCGKCAIKGLLELHDKYGVHLAVATGGTIARRIVVQKRPRMIVAVACERDLSSGIQDTYPLPVYGVLNMRPNGPCLDTDVSLKNVETALLRFLDPKYHHGVQNEAPEDMGETISTGEAAGHVPTN